MKLRIPLERPGHTGLLFQARRRAAQRWQERPVVQAARLSGIATNAQRRRGPDGRYVRANQAHVPDHAAMTGASESHGTEDGRALVTASTAPVRRPGQTALPLDYVPGATP